MVRWWVACLALFCSSPSFGAVYYVSSETGSDTNDGLAPGSAFETVTHINSLPLEAGDEVRFFCGETWRVQTLVVTRSGSAGSPIVFSSHPADCADKPVLSGAQPISGWSVAAPTWPRHPFTTSRFAAISSATPWGTPTVPTPISRGCSAWRSIWIITLATWSWRTTRSPVLPGPAPSSRTPRAPSRATPSTTTLFPIGALSYRSSEVFLRPAKAVTSCSRWVSIAARSGSATRPSSPPRTTTTSSAPSTTPRSPMTRPAAAT